MGTLGLLARAKQVGLVLLLRPLFAQLEAAGWFIDPALLEAVLEECGEA